MAYVLLSCGIIYRFARELWGTLEGTIAAGLLAFYLTFGIPSAVMALAPDLLMIPAHIAAVYCAWRGRAFVSGLLASVCLLFNSKGIFVAVVCLLWQSTAMPKFLAGFALPQAALIAYLLATGSLPAYWQQVWSWGSRYTADSFVANPVSEALKRTLNWAGFHAAVIGAGVVYARREGNRRFALWAVLSYVAVVAGFRFFPRYFFQLLPVACLAGGRGFTIVPQRWRSVFLILLLIPLIRFAPRYAILTAEQFQHVEHSWQDTAMMRDSAVVGRQLRSLSTARDTLLVWGYRPDVFVFSGLPAGTRFLDSQPLTGVIADRHLTSSQPTFPDLAQANRRELIHTSPAFIVDGLGPLNPKLAITSYSDLRPWFDRYERAGHTEMSVIYRLRSPHR
jgi:hypothetical protein